MTINERLEALTQSVQLIASLRQYMLREKKKTTVEIRKLARLVRVIVLDRESRLVALEGEDEGDAGTDKST